MAPNSLSRYDIWARTPKGTLVIASNTRHIPNIPQWNYSLRDTTRIPRVDGRWGFQEYSLVPQPFAAMFPYLAFIPSGSFERFSLPMGINRFRLGEDSPEFARQAGWGHRGYLRTDVREGLQKDVVWYIDRIGAIVAAEDAQKDGIHERLGVKPPVIAMVRAHNACFSTRFPHLTYRDLLEYLAGLQLAIGELQAYLLWYERIQYESLPTTLPTCDSGLRGSIANTSIEYDRLRLLGVPVWWELPTSQVVHLDPAKERVLSDTGIETRLWANAGVTPSLQDTRKGVLVHNKPLEYYPPCVDNQQELETAARGYSSRLDGYNQDRHTVADVRKMLENTNLSGGNHNRSASLAKDVRRAGEQAGDLMDRYAADRAILPGPDAPPPAKSKASAPSSKWYRQYTDIKKSHTECSWSSKFVTAWEMGSCNTGYYPMVHNIKLNPKCKDLLLFTAPPPHLFMKKGDDKESRMLFVWICIRHGWLARMDRDVECQQVASWGLTTQQWREILGGTYWKFKHPKEGEHPFEWRYFWRHGGTMVLGPEEKDWATVDISPFFSRSSTGRLELEHLGDDGVKSLIIWDLSLCLAQLQLDRADEILHTQKIKSGIEQNIRRGRRSGLFHEPDWQIPTKTVPWERGDSEPQKRHWVARFVEVVNEWSCESQMAWFFAEHRLSEVIPEPGNTQLHTFCKNLPDAQLRMLELSAVAVYYQGVFDALGTLATGVMKKPQNNSCTDQLYGHIRVLDLTTPKQQLGTTDEAPIQKRVECYYSWQGFS
ncbi:hypothetical protein FB451DRAFT_1172133 [Mycena latifolia]|nr:hypothetical protein FB451DRAFT_1172133 [Mycena latifolia]